MLVNYTIAKDPLPEFPGGMYEYIMAGNGIFLRAARQGLEVLFPIVETTIRGLPELQPYLRLGVRNVPRLMLGFVLAQALEAKQTEGDDLIEVMFYLDYRDGCWWWMKPNQKQSRVSVDYEPTPREAQSLVEIHSHHTMAAFFSQTDNTDQTGFRIYAVLGHITTTPTILVRVGVYGHFWNVPMNWVFEEVPGLLDASVNDDGTTKEEKWEVFLKANV